MKAFLLLLTAIVLFVLLAPFGIVTAIVLLFVKDSREQFSKFSDYPYGIAHTIDILGNIICGDLFNVTLIKHGGYRFGVRTETISSVLGKNKRSNKLTKTGNLIANILDAIDSNHCINSIQQIPNYLLKPTNMLNQFFLLPHLNCHIIEIDGVPLNVHVQQLQAPFEVFSENCFFGVILWGQPSSQKAKIMDLIATQEKEIDINEFVGTRPDPRR
jgi:hypothetical protein